MNLNTTAICKSQPIIYTLETKFMDGPKILNIMLFNQNYA